MGLAGEKWTFILHFRETKPQHTIKKAIKQPKRKKKNPLEGLLYRSINLFLSIWGEGRGAAKEGFRRATIQINLQSLQLSLGKENPELFQCSFFPLFKEKECWWDSQAYLESIFKGSFLSWGGFFPPWWSKLNSHCLPQTSLQPRAWASLTLQRPKPQREETLSLEARSHWHWPRGGMRGVSGPSPYPRTPNPQPNSGPRGKEHTGRKLGVG